MTGVQNQIGMGMAQVTPDSGVNPLHIAAQIQQNKRYNELLKLQKQENDERRQKSLLGIVGDALNPRIFEKEFTNRVLSAQKDIVKRIQSNPNGYSDADVALMSQNAAQDIAKLNDIFLNAENAIKGQSGRYAKSERIDRTGLEAIARKNVLDDIGRSEKGESVDFTKDYFNLAKSQHPYSGLIDDSDAIDLKLGTVDYQDIGDTYSEKNKYGATETGSYSAKVLHPFYEIVDKGRGNVPEFKIKGEPSLFSTEKLPISKLKEDAYQRFILNQDNEDVLNRRLIKKYPDLDINSKDAEELRRVEAYEYLKNNVPQRAIKTADKKVEAPVVRVYTGSSVSKDGDSLNLSNYPKIGSDYDITELMSGINVSAISGEPLKADKVLYNPDTKTVTYTDLSGRTKKTDFDTFRQNIATINTGIDLKEVDKLRKSKRPETAKPESEMVTVVLSDGRKGQIPSTEVDKFLKENKGSKRQ